MLLRHEGKGMDGKGRELDGGNEEKGKGWNVVKDEGRYKFLEKETG